MKTKLQCIFSIAMVLACFSTQAQTSYWTSATTDRTTSEAVSGLDARHYKVYQLEQDKFAKTLASAPLRGTFSGKSNTTVTFPNEKGELESFNVIEVKTLSDALAARHPDIKTYLGFGVKDPLKRIRFSVTPSGVKSMLTGPDIPMTLIQPMREARGQYLVYNRLAKRNVKREPFECLTTDVAQRSSRIDGPTNRDANDQTLRTFEIAISTTGEYTNFWDDGSDGDTKDDAFAELVSTLNRSNEVFETDMAITFQLVSGLSIVYDNPGSDPYTGSFSSQLQSTLTSQIGEANYDIGHLFHRVINPNDNSGSAGCIGCVCVDGSKGSGWSSHSFLDNDGGPYMSDFFDIDYVPHEIGHQMGANHTWSFQSEGTGVNYEPGSGTTIMGYAGITGGNDVQDHSDPYFHYASIDQILDNLDAKETAGTDCWDNTAISNNPPVAEAGPNYVIPQGTAFVLRGSATDADGGDTLTYTWEQIDNGVTTNGSFGPTKTSGAIFRSRPPSTSPDRYMPQIERIIAGQLTETNPVETVDNSSWETVSTIDRDLNFALTVRDRMPTATGQTPQSSFDTMLVDVDGASGPFTVTSQTTNETWFAGTTQTVTWNVAGTDSGNVNTSNVNIRLSTDGGFTYPFTLATSVPNDGSHDITVPVGAATTQARVMVEGDGNIFFAINSTDFTIEQRSFVITVNNNDLEVCSPDDAVFDLTYSAFSGFSETTTFSTTGLLGGASATFNPTSASADGTNVQLTISGIGGLAVGSYTFDIVGTAPSETNSVSATFNVFDASLTTVTLTAPTDGAIGVSVDPTSFAWNADANAASYDIDIASDSGFNTIINSDNVTTNSYDFSGLLTNTQYWWRVRPRNNCAIGSYTSASFTTANVACNSQGSTDTPVSIPDNNATGADSVIDFASNLVNIDDVNVTVNITHTFTGDLILTLTSPGGTSVILSNRNGGSGEDYTSTVFDDDGATPISSGSAPFTGTFSPDNPLSAFNGESALGNWTLNVSDNAGIDTGTIDSWSLEVCGEQTLAVESISDANFAVYPNPNNGEFSIRSTQLLTADVIKVEVYDLNGRRIYNNDFAGQGNFYQVINLGNPTSGIYLLRISDGNNVSTRKLLMR